MTSSPTDGRACLVGKGLVKSGFGATQAPQREEHRMTVRTHRLPDAFFGDYSDKGLKTKARREELARERGLEPCEACGRGVAEGSGWVIVVTDGGSSVLHPDDAQTDEAQEDRGFMGSYVWGPECGRKVPAEFRTRWNGWDA